MSRLPRIVLIAAVAVLAVAGAAFVLLRSTGPDRPGHAEVMAAIKKDPRTADVPDPAASCVADWYLRYASDEQLDALMEGHAEAPTGAAQSPAAESAILDCLKEAT
ncbi:hypothetical protein ACPCHT_27525 [Nucisporomicrobium flavum]|uniref:hypothetical protein n=1 Tax=Nucisporomicrobium flavum TaxID=2785915 RepID=UPI003C2CD8F6